MIYITEKDLLSMRELGGGVFIRKNYKNWGILNLRTGDRILMKLDI